MNTITEERPKRKVLSLKLDKQEGANQPRFVEKKQSVFMVWRDGGNMPVRVYRKPEEHMALKHAQDLCESTGQRFYVMRSWRAFDPL